LNEASPIFCPIWDTFSVLDLYRVMAFAGKAFFPACCQAESEKLKFSISFAVLIY